MDAGIRIRVKVDDRELRRAMRGFEKSIPFALSKGVNAIASKAASELRAHLRADGLIPITGWMGKERAGIQFRPQDWARAKGEKFTATLSIMSHVAAVAAQPGGGIRHWPGLVPVVGSGGAREREHGPLRPDLRKNNATLDRILAQKARTPRGALRFIRKGQTIYEKTGPATKRKRGTGSRLVLSGPLVAVFRIPRGPVKIPNRWKLQERVATVQRRWAVELMAEAVQYAIANYKP